MSWKPIDLVDLQAQIAAGLQAASDDLKSFHRRVAREPTKWDLHPWGDRGGGFWVVAVLENQVLWFNDIEEGFNVSTFQREGQIPDDQYWCNQDEYHWALKRLREGDDYRLGPPRPIWPG